MTTQAATTHWTAPAMRFNAYAFSKYLYGRDAVDTEISFFGVTAENDPNLIIDLIIPPQECSSAYTEFDDGAISDLLEAMADLGYSPDRWSRVWLHTHPGASASPSGTDENTFRDDFLAEFACMIILARGGELYCRQRFQLKNGMKFAAKTDCKVDWGAPFQASNHALWQKQIDANVKKKSYSRPATQIGFVGGNGVTNNPHRSPFEWEKDELPDEKGSKKKKDNGNNTESNAATTTPAAGAGNPNGYRSGTAPRYPSARRLGPG